MSLIQLLVDGLALGAAYALVAAGFVLVISATGAVNFAQGDLVMAGGYIALVLAGWSGLPGWLLLPLVMAVMAGVGLLVAALAYAPLRNRPPVTVFVSTIAVGVMLQNGANALFGAEPRATPALLGSGVVSLGGLVLARQSIAVIGAAAVIFAALGFTLARTQLGRQLRATAQDRTMAAALGIPVGRMIALTFALSAALAGSAGLLLSNTYFLTPTEGGIYIVKAYIAVAIGGWGSLTGALLGACLIALFESVYPALPALLPGLPNAWFSQSVSTIMLYGVLVLILCVRPQGLMPASAQGRV
ncbi:MAG: branched-chain amino acid ABC transporter permease [Acetobacteraceae bacterium]